jgi:hypothetical protein
MHHFRNANHQIIREAFACDKPKMVDNPDKLPYKTVRSLVRLHNKFGGPGEVTLGHNFYIRDTPKAKYYYTWINTEAGDSWYRFRKDQRDDTVFDPTDLAFELNVFIGLKPTRWAFETIGQEKLQELVCRTNPEAYDPEEANDCVVNAFARVLGITYKEAHELCATHMKRKPKCGVLAFYSHKFLTEDLHEVTGHTATLVAGASRLDNRGHYKRQRTCDKYPTIASFLKSEEAQNGRYIVSIRGHMTSVIDGVLHDDWLMPYSRKRIRRIFRIEKSKMSC